MIHNIKTFMGHTDIVTSVLFTSKNVPISASEDGTIRIWSMGKEKEYAKFVYLNPKDSWIILTADGHYAKGEDFDEKYLNISIKNKFLYWLKNSAIPIENINQYQDIYREKYLKKYNDLENVQKILQP